MLVVAGSASRPSRSRALAAVAAVEVDRAGAQPALWDLSEHRVLMPGAGARDVVQRFRSAVCRADALVLVTPLRHNSYSGLLKSALDQLSPEHLRNRPVALVSEGSEEGGTQALDHLRVVVSALGGVAVPRQVVAREEHFEAGGAGYEVVDRGVERSLAELGAELVWFARCLSADESPLPVALPGAAPGRTAPVAAPARTRIADDEDNPMRRALSFIQDNFADSGLCLDDAARRAYLSRYHFSRVFKARVGIRFIEYVTQLRMSDAVARLRDTDDTVTSICHAVGYRDLSHFERVFRKCHGVSPSSYRLRHRVGRRAG